MDPRYRRLLFADFGRYTHVHVLGIIYLISTFQWQRWLGRTHPDHLPPLELH